MRKYRYILMVTVSVVACADESTHADVTVRDSAGTTLVEHTGQAAPNIWTVRSDPTVVIGRRDGPEAQILFRVAAAFRLHDGRIVVANGGSTEFRFYDSTGVHLASTGGAGGGPGEMRVLFEVTRLNGDTLVAFDPAPGRLDWFDPDGQFVHRTSVDLRALIQPPHFTEGAHLLPDQTILMRVYEGSASRLPPGLYRPTVGFFRFDLRSGVIDTLTWMGGLENFVIEGSERPMANVRPFPRRAVEAWSSTTIYVADTDRYEVRAFGLEDKAAGIIRRSREGPRVTATDRTTFEEEFREFVSRNPYREGDMNRWLAAVPYPDTKPPIANLFGDRLGRLWVEETAVNDTDPVVWAVFDQAGLLKAQVELKPRFTPLDIGADYVLGVFRDRDDVEFVEMYELRN